MNSRNIIALAKQLRKVKLWSMQRVVNSAL